MDYEYQCNHCNYIFNIEQEDVRTKSKLSIPEGVDKDTNISYLPDPNESFFKDKNPEIKGAFKALKDRGLKITSYHEESPK